MAENVKEILKLHGLVGVQSVYLGPIDRRLDIDFYPEGAKLVGYGLARRLQKVIKNLHVVIVASLLTLSVLAL